MQNILDKAYDKYAQGSVSNPGLHQDLLCDPNLVEDYTDILKSMPRKPAEEEENSVNGSVVLSKTHANSPQSYRSSILSNGSSNYSIPSHAADSEAISENNEDMLEGGYEYSDSEFEDNLETRLKQMDSESRRDEGSGSSTEEQSSDDDLTVDAEQNEDDDEDDYQPLPPPQEMDPDKLYALYPFQGPDPSHCQLYQDQSCILLNDQDSYWWLIKRCDDGRIGFAPAELLETFPERLARLNCWKNENMSGQSLGSNSTQSKNVSIHEETTDRMQLSSPYNKSSKSVSFNDVVSYAERYMEEDDEEDDPLSTEENPNALEVEDKLYERKVDLHEDDASEVTSDVSFNTGSTLPLQVKKVRQRADREKKDEMIKSFESDLAKDNLKSPDDDLRQVFQAPSMPFAGNKDMPKSNSNYSISTIGEYSPSSSEWTNDSPQINGGEFDVGTTEEGIPSTRAIQDISKIVGEINDDETYDAEDEHEAGLACLSESVSKTTKDDLKIQRESISLSSEESCIDDGRGTSATTLNSTASLSDEKFSHHPIVIELYNPLFSRIDDLMKKLNQVLTE
ncbi:LAFE_0B12090g1_1 [Lachancea fermentati]|uniref:LAFE_0B12090g1_1 n=1 Tax=Lachancea fermentati TaxID=4955 RepID=A0A1G4M8Q4_LACFM|nr:LAFE_0B12090g1_1 [Lachancea fermentati]